MRVGELARDAVLSRKGLPIPGPGLRIAVPVPSERLQNLVELARTVSGQPVTAINIITEDLQYQVASAGMEPYVCSREDSMCAVGFLNGTSTVLEDASLDPRYSSNPFVDGRRGAVRFYASVPLVSDDGFVLGTLCAGARETGRLSDRQRQGLEILAAEVVEALTLQHRAGELASALTEAQRSNTLLAEFAGRISHDLRNPLTSILGYVELSQAEAQNTPDAKIAQYLDVVAGSGQRMLDMVEDVLAYATVGGDVRPVPLSLTALVGEVIQDLDASLEASSAVVEVDDLSFSADPVQMRVLLQNLIHNSVAYCRPGVPPVIRVTGERRDGGVVVRVIDNGKGISEADRERVLDPLVRLHREDDPPGTGLGLATCARIAAAAGGRLGIGPASGPGTVVTIHLGSDS
ncbi:GAF domain-containing sensor histidine kinase [Arthrobacter sp. SIMBA_036]|uniref:sensor histidine kinase n=1 Tax=Arthrobacter sp. SIMBA_036 TaxID=3085778 RepID=UPI00397E62E3